MTVLTGTSRDIRSEVTLCPSIVSHGRFIYECGMSMLISCGSSISFCVLQKQFSRLGSRKQQAKTSQNQFWGPIDRSVTDAPLTKELADHALLYGNRFLYELNCCFGNTYKWFMTLTCQFVVTANRLTPVTHLTCCTSSTQLLKNIELS